MPRNGATDDLSFNGLTSNHTVDAVDDSIIPGFTALARSSQRHGMRTFVQLWHGGHRWAPVSGGAPLSASNVPCPLGTVNTPFAMTQDQIDRLIANDPIRD